MNLPPMPQDDVWIHEPAYDAGGCTQCGAFAQVNEDCMCEDCFDMETNMRQGTFDGEKMFYSKTDAPFDIVGLILVDVR